MATLTRGYTFGSTETVTSAKLSALVDNGSVSNIGRADVSSTSSLITKQSTAPSAPSTGEFWFDTTLNLLRRWDGSAWQVVARGVVRTADATFAVGEVACVDTGTAGRVSKTTSTSSHSRIVGIAAEVISSGSSGVFLTDGLATVLVTAATSLGQLLVMSAATSGSTDPVSPNATDTGVVGTALSTTAGAGSVTAYLKTASAGVAMAPVAADAIAAGNAPTSSNPFLTQSALQVAHFASLSTTGTTPVGTGAVGFTPKIAFVVGVLAGAADSGFVGIVTGTGSAAKSVAFSAVTTIGASVDANAAGGRSVTGSAGTSHTTDLDCTAFSSSDIEFTPAANVAGGTWTLHVVVLGTLP